MTPPAPLIERHLPLVRAIAGRHDGRGEPLEDLVQVGSIGLVKAAGRYDASRGTTFAAYAAPFVAGEIRHHLRDRCAPVRVPRRLQAEGVRVFAVGLDSLVEHDDPLARTEDRLALGTALQALRPRERQIVGLRFVDELSQAQIARRTGLSQVHVSRMLRDALTQLRDELATPSTIG